MEERNPAATHHLEASSPEPGTPYLDNIRPGDKLLTEKERNLYAIVGKFYIRKHMEVKSPEDRKNQDSKGQRHYHIYPN
jgi:hypothetical protein